MTLTRKQMGAFFGALNKAAGNLGLKGEEVEAYRKRVMMEETGRSSLKDLANQTEFSRLLARALYDAGDWAGAARIDTTGGSQLANVATGLAGRIIAAKGWKDGENNRVAYVEATIGRMRRQPADAGRGGAADGGDAADGRRGGAADGRRAWYADYTLGQLRAAVAALSRYARKLEGQGRA